MIFIKDINNTFYFRQTQPIDNDNFDFGDKCDHRNFIQRLENNKFYICNNDDNNDGNDDDDDVDVDDNDDDDGYDKNIFNCKTVFDIVC